MQRRRVIIIDPSLRDNIGHHIEYDRAISRAASARDLETVVLAHKEVGKSVDDFPSALPVYSSDMWRIFRVPPDRDVLIKRLPFIVLSSPAHAIGFAVRMVLKLRRWLRALFRRQQTYTAPRQPTGKAAQSDSRQSVALSTQGPLSQLLPPIILQPRNALDALKRARGPIAYFRRLVLIATPPAVLGITLGGWQLATRALENFAPPPWLLLLFFRNPTFYLETRKALARLQPAMEDAIFCHMVNRDNLLELCYLALKGSSRSGGRLVLLLRYPPAYYAAESLFGKLAFRALERAYEKGVLRLATDSSRLAKEFAEYCYVPPEIFPIPHTAATETERDVQNVAGKRTIRFASLGNARAEKGILEILAATRMLPRTIEDQNVEFLLQVNDPDAQCRSEIFRFRQDAPSNVTFIDRALSSDEYRRALESVDVVLAPYWRDIYQSRTSGIFLEAVAAGKPVVATKDTWMEDELSKYGAGSVTHDRDPQDLASTIIRVALDFANLSRIAKATAKNCRAIHSPERLLALLLGEKSQSRPTSRSALVIFPWAGLAERAAGAALRVGLLLDFLRQHRTEPIVICLQPRERAPNAASSYYELGNESSDSNLNRILWLYKLWMRLRSLGRSYQSEFLLYAFQLWHRRRSARILLNRLVAQVSVVYVEYAFLADLVAPFCRAYGVPLVVTEHDVLAQQSADPEFRARLLDYETRGLRQANLPVCVSQSDHDVFKERGLELTIVPNAIDLKTIVCPSVEEAEHTLRDFGIPQGDFILFVGSAHGPNFEAKNFLINSAKELGQGPNRVMVIVAGSCSSPSETGGNFFGLGQIPPALLRALYSRACVVVIPLRRGTGTSLKTIEAMAYGCPVLGTPVAFRGLPVRPEIDAYVEVDLNRYPALLRHICRSDEHRRKVGRNARAVAQRYDYTCLYAPYVEYLSKGRSLEPFGAERQPEPPKEGHIRADRTNSQPR